jgi:hypothetical protein
VDGVQLVDRRCVHYGGRRPGLPNGEGVRERARLVVDACPDPEAIAAREGRLTRERAESAFETAADRRDRRDDGERT